MLNKYFIKQFIINNNEDFQEWQEQELSTLLNNNCIIGYFFARRKELKTVGQIPEVLNLYLIKKTNYNGLQITLESLANAWEFFKCNKTLLFENPPIENWLDTKDNWCKKLATRLTLSYGGTFSERMSDIYMSVMLLYRKGNVYMGNLNYVEKSIINFIKTDIRYWSSRVNEGNSISLSTAINDGEDDEIITGEDLLTDGVDITTDLDYQQLLQRAKTLLSETFSKREIDMILNDTPATVMPRGTYDRLCKFRYKHNRKELVNEE